MNLFKRCSQSFTCSDKQKTVHFKFDRFEIEKGFDYFIIGDPNTFKCIEKMEHLNYREGLNLKCIDRQALILTGNQSHTETYIEAKSITEFHISFFRMVLKAT